MTSALASLVRPLRMPALLAGFVAAFMAFAQPAQAADAAAFIDSLGQKALSSLTTPDLDQAEREKRVRGLLRSYFDIDVIARFTLGPAWRSATDAQKSEYVKLFEKMIVKTYAQRFSEYSGQQMKVGRATEASERDTIVASQIIQKDGPPVAVQWRVRKKGGDIKIIDVIVEGISMSVTQRSDFNAVIQNGGMEALLKSLRERTGG